MLNKKYIVLISNHLFHTINTHWGVHGIFTKPTGAIYPTRPTGSQRSYELYSRSLRDKLSLTQHLVRRVCKHRRAAQYSVAIPSVLICWCWVIALNWIASHFDVQQSIIWSRHRDTYVKNASSSFTLATLFWQKVENSEAQHSHSE